MKALSILFSLLFLLIGSACSSTSMQVITPDIPTQGYADGSFSFSGGRTLRGDSSFEIRWRGNTPPPQFQVRVKSLGDVIHFFSPKLNIYVKSSQFNDNWWGHKYEYFWICFPKDWENETNYLVSIGIDEQVICSEVFYFR